MFVIGIVLLLLGYFLGISILSTIGLVLTIVGAVLFLLGGIGYPIAGRRHFW